MYPPNVFFEPLSIGAGIGNCLPMTSMPGHFSRQGVSGHFRYTVPGTRFDTFFGGTQWAFPGSRLYVYPKLELAQPRRPMEAYVPPASSPDALFAPACRLKRTHTLCRFSRCLSRTTARGVFWYEPPFLAPPHGCPRDGKFVRNRHWFCANVFFRHTTIKILCCTV